LYLFFKLLGIYIQFEDEVQQRSGKCLQIDVLSLSPGSTEVNASVTYDTGSNTTDPVAGAVNDANETQSFGNLTVFGKNQW
jgi:hypothetical protein